MEIVEVFRVQGVKVRPISQAAQAIVMAQSIAILSSWLLQCHAQIALDYHVMTQSCFSCSFSVTQYDSVWLSTMSELRASWQPTSPQIMIFDMAAFCIPACWLRIRNSHLVMLLLSSSSLSHHFHLLWCPSTNRTTSGCCHYRRTPGPSSR